MLVAASRAVEVMACDYVEGGPTHEILVRGWLVRDGHDGPRWVQGVEHISGVGSEYEAHWLYPGEDEEFDNGGLV